MHAEVEIDLYCYNSSMVELFTSESDVQSFNYDIDEVFAALVYRQWLKCKIRGGGMLHSGLGP